MQTEKIVKPQSGYPFLAIIIALAIAIIVLFIGRENAGLGALLIVVLVFLGRGLLVISPNSAKILLLFGAYQGSIKRSGLFWVNPLYQRMTLSLRARNFQKEKVNDKMGNPVMISVILVWKVSDTFKSTFEVDNYKSFIEIQTDSAVRKLAATYPYDHFEDEKATITLSTDFDEINHTLEKEI